MPIAVKWMKVADLLPYANNAKTHPEEQIAKLAGLMLEHGWDVPIVVDKNNVIIKGHGRRLAALKLQEQGTLDQVGGTKAGLLPVVVRDDLTDAQVKAARLADNRIAETEWDPGFLRLELEQLDELGISGLDLGFDQFELDSLFGEGEDGDGTEDDNYSRKVVAPIYEPTGPKPAVSELYSEKKTRELREEIEAADIPEDIKVFLRAAADRHTVFDFAKIANYYAQSDPIVQDHMERSALIIIDFNKAIEYGFIKLTEEIRKQYAYDYKDGDAGEFEDGDEE